MYPYFVGVFDTVAALGSFWKTLLFTGMFLAATGVVSAVISLVSFFPNFPYIGRYLGYVTFMHVFATFCGGAFAFALGLFVYTHIKFDFRVPGYPLWKQLLTIHPTAIWQTFYDYTLDDHIGYAKHTISIDENRKDFARVPWGKISRIGHRETQMGIFGLNRYGFLEITPTLAADTMKMNLGCPTPRSNGC